MAKRILRLILHRKKSLFFMFFLCGISSAYFTGTAQKLVFDGYLTNMQSVMFEKWDENWLSENRIHNRLDFTWYANDHFTLDLEVRNRFIYGEFMKYYPDYSQLIDSETGWMDLSWMIVDKPSFLLHTTIDRAWIDYSAGSFQIRAGRQRINWGQTLIWNPNDIFNAYSYFDFDYPEKPGSDAIRIQYYTGNASDIDLAVKLDSADRVTAAGRFLFSAFDYDIQLLGGIFNSEDLVLGAGWSGHIGGAGFRGEGSWFHSGKGDHKEEFMISLSGDYTFKNSLYLGLEFLYSNIAYNFDDFGQFYFMPLNVKYITFTDFNFMLQVSYPFTPLLNGTFAGIYYPSEDGFFVGPGIEYSMLENISLSFYLQHFKGNFSSALSEKFTFGFLRLKWNF